MNLFEAYKKRLAVAEKVYAAKHPGETMDTNRKLVVATCLKNINGLLNEAFGAGSATQSGAAVSVLNQQNPQTLGNYKKFSMNLTNVALPNLIANDLVMVYPMTSFSGYVNYIQYQYGEAKGDIEQGDRIADPFGFQNNTAKNFDKYTSAQVVTEALTEGTGAQTLSWTPVAHGLDYNASTSTYTDAHVISTSGTKTYVYISDDGKLYTDAAKASQYTVVSGDKLAYFYDNVVIPQNKLPTVKAVMKSIPLLAHARRIAVYFSQIAAFQAKTDYGFDLSDALAERAVSELSYEIDTEVVKLLDDNAPEDVTLSWSKTQPVGVSMREHFDSFLNTLAKAKQIVYDATQKFVPNWLLVASDIVPVLSMISAFKAAPTGQVNGPYFAGTVDSFKVFVSPALASGKFIAGVLGSDMYSAAAVYAPYMPIVPTQLLGFADGGMSQGWSTLYDLKMLNPSLLVKGQIVD